MEKQLKIVRCWNYIADFIHSIKPLLPIFLIGLIPYLLLVWTSQGDDIIEIITENFSQIPTWKKISSTLIFSIFFLFILIYSVLHGIAATGYQHQVEKSINRLKTVQCITNGILIPSVSILVPLLYLNYGLKLYFDYNTIISYISLIILFGLLLYTYNLFIPKHTATIFKNLSDTKNYYLERIIYSELPKLIVLIAFFHYLHQYSTDVGSKPITVLLVIIAGIYYITKLVLLHKTQIYRIALNLKKTSKKPTDIFFLAKRILKLFGEINKNASRLILFALAAFFFMVYVIDQLLNPISPSLTSIIIGFLVINIIITKIDYLNFRYHRSYAYIIIVGLIISFLIQHKIFDGQLAINTINYSNLEHDNSIKNNYEKWLNDRTKQGLFNQDTNRIYLIASEGGGIRSAFWTTGLLCKLDSIFPAIGQKTYAFSGVSGGSVGEMFYCALKKDRLQNKSILWHQIIGQDFLANALHGITIGKLMQSFIPYSLEMFDRARILENDWAAVYKQKTSFNTLNESIYNLYNDSLNFQVPNIFFNTTHVESGKKAIVSNLDLDQNFNQDIDLLKIMKGVPPLKTAGLLSARFPGISPAGLIVDKQGEKWGKIVDGGYHDNSGLGTIKSLLETITSINTKETNIRPVVLFIRNNNQHTDNVKYISPEFKAPINAFLNSWAVNTEKNVDIMMKLAKSQEFDFIELKLNYQTENETEDYPLGWTLSKKSQAKIIDKINGLGHDNFNNIDRENKGVFDLLSSWELANKN